jgi:antitoxin PrlF
MRAMKLSMVQEKGQVTIPASIRRKLGVKKGDLVAFIETEDGVLISPREAVAVKALEEIGAALKAKGLSLDDLMEKGRDIRGKLLEEEYGIKSE